MCSVLVFRDNNTPKPFVEDFSKYLVPDDKEGASAALPDHVYVDAMGFGMGCCCLQVTFQVRFMPLRSFASFLEI